MSNKRLLLSWIIGAVAIGVCLAAVVWSVWSLTSHPIERVITGVETFIAFVGLLYLLREQFRLGPRDKQEWSAVLFVVSTTAIVGQLSLSYLFTIPLGTGTRGNISYALWVASIVWFVVCTRRHNRRVGRSVRNDREESDRHTTAR